MKSLDDLYTLNNIFTEFWFAKYCNLAYYNWAIVSKETKEAIGRIWAVRTDEKLQQAELAYELGVHWWNQGLMTEAVNAIISFLFSEIGYNRIYADHASGNPASGSVMKKCNMQYEGTQRQALCCNAGLFDKVNYAILAEEYFKEANS
jgi:ribosomal-protein-alanine N-acetyltransferase